ncbi:hypothetical protein HIM_04129 [Hirsutella minnesotensis 3608]|uniref:Adenine DNA glycosylase n=1 Tax=Hirsutella minnesotensis 3608 TaxID=1043627 RepID=A0A0F7ZQ03_9HYPO|nr:hypothetical protein HIM_04129 [Hirsutella minnesotensis 3608]
MVRRSGRLSAAGSLVSKKSKTRQQSEESCRGTESEALALKAESDSVDGDGPRKKRKTGASRGSSASQLHLRLFSADSVPVRQHSCLPPTRLHTCEYHIPLLLNGQDASQNRRVLLSWFDSVRATRAMPWRKPWINPESHANDVTALRQALERRAYEVWISEIMLQQTRVAVVIDYWNRWMDRWPTIQHLAAAEADDVLAAWRGLGYYSRATRIHEAAKLVVQDPQMRGLLPADTGSLEARVPGVGRYTAGAISSIVFGRAAAMVDGNVLRVLSRQLGIHANVKTDKMIIDTIWAAAAALVNAVAQDGETHEEASITVSGSEPARVSDRPGRWGQALMELGSTICTPKPDCSSCPVTATCRVYGEGVAMAKKDGSSAAKDIEDLCGLCESFDEGNEPEPLQAQGKKASTSEKGQARPRTKQMSLAGFIMKSDQGTQSQPVPKRSAADAETIAEHARRFPAKVIKKPVRVEETIVCAIQHPNGGYLIEKRPQKGLLAGLWEMPSVAIGEPAETTGRTRKQMALAHAGALVRTGDGTEPAELEHVGELGSVPWLFSHIRLTMHVHLFNVRDDACRVVEGEESRPRRWSNKVDDESMGTGMRKCWALVKDAQPRIQD